MMILFLTFHLFSCFETIKNDKKWLLSQEDFIDFITMQDSIMNVKFNFDTNLVTFEMINPIISKIELRDIEISKKWYIKKNGNTILYINKINSLKKITKTYLNGKYQYKFFED